MFCSLLAKTGFREGPSPLLLSQAAGVSAAMCPFRLTRRSRVDSGEGAQAPEFFGKLLCNGLAIFSGRKLAIICHDFPLLSPQSLHSAAGKTESPRREAILSWAHLVGSWRARMETFPAWSSHCLFSTFPQTHTYPSHSCSVSLHMQNHSLTPDFRDLK